LHLEGPWISAEAPGAMARDAIRPYDASTDREVLARADGQLRMVTLAPEVEGADALLTELSARGVIAALGHTHASPDCIREAIERGLRHVTHLWNAMGPTHHRAPGVAGTALAEDRLTCDLICDGHHVDPAIVRIAARALGERLVLITDRLDVPAGAEGSALGAIRAGADGEPWRRADGTIAGSQLSLDGALRNARRFAGLGLCEAVAACTLRPATLLGVERERGTLRRGTRADLALLDPDGRVVETWIAGAPTWTSETFRSDGNRAGR
jgi:N-acetylglucosamine-6-phosphate deacetylase